MGNKSSSSSAPSTEEPVEVQATLAAELLEIRSYFRDPQQFGLYVIPAEAKTRTRAVGRATTPSQLLFQDLLGAFDDYERLIQGDLSSWTEDESYKARSKALQRRFASIHKANNAYANSTDDAEVFARFLTMYPVEAVDQIQNELEEHIVMLKETKDKRLAGAGPNKFDSEMYDMEQWRGKLLFVKDMLRFVVLDNHPILVGLDDIAQKLQSPSGHTQVTVYPSQLEDCRELFERCKGLEHALIAKDREIIKKMNKMYSTPTEEAKDEDANDPIVHQAAETLNVSRTQLFTIVDDVLRGCKMPSDLVRMIVSYASVEPVVFALEMYPFMYNRIPLIYPSKKRSSPYDLGNTCLEWYFEGVCSWRKWLGSGDKAAGVELSDPSLAAKYPECVLYSPPSHRLHYARELAQYLEMRMACGIPQRKYFISVLIAVFLKQFPSSLWDPICAAAGENSVVRPVFKTQEALEKATPKDLRDWLRKMERGSHQLGDLLSAPTTTEQLREKAAVLDGIVTFDMPVRGVARIGAVPKMNKFLDILSRANIRVVKGLVHGVDESHGDNWCFSSDSLLLVPSPRQSTSSIPSRSAFTRVPVASVRPGDAVCVFAPDGSGVSYTARVVAVVRSQLQGAVEMADLSTLPADPQAKAQHVQHQGHKHTPTWITVDHPVLVPNEEKAMEWRLPRDVCSSVKWKTPDFVYNLVLEKGHIVDVGGVRAATLAHGFRGPVIEHPFWGTGVCVQALRQRSDWPFVTVSARHPVHIPLHLRV